MPALAISRALKVVSITETVSAPIGSGVAPA
jgi:hypothetical protein